LTGAYVENRVHNDNSLQSFSASLEPDWIRGYSWQSENRESVDSFQVRLGNTMQIRKV